jgi:hypothetical protein
VILCGWEEYHVTMVSGQPDAIADAREEKRTPGGPCTSTMNGGGSSGVRSITGTCMRRCSFSALTSRPFLARTAELKMNACRRQPPRPR